MSGENRFGGKTRPIRFGDVAEAAVVKRIKELRDSGKTREQALDAVAQERRISLDEIKKIADQHGL